jgi:hypothetical protein
MGSSVVNRIVAALGSGSSSIQDGKMALVLVQFVYMIILIVFRFTAHAFDFYEGEQTSQWKQDVEMCSGLNYADSNASIVCFQTQVTYRVSWAVAFLFMFLTLMSLAGFGVRALTGFFVVKLLVPLAFFFFFVFLWPDVFFTYMAYVGGFLSVFALLYLFIMVINFGAKLSSRRVDPNTGESNPVKKVASLVLGVLLFAASITGTVFLAHDYPLNKASSGVSSIEDRRWLVAGSCIFMFVCLLISLLPIVKHGSFLVSSLMMALVTTFCWGASLNNYEDIAYPNGLMFHTHIAFFIVMVLWFLVALLAASTESVPVEKHDGEIHAMIDDLEKKTSNLTTEDKKEVKKLDTALYLFFHTCIPFALMSLMYTENTTTMSKDVRFWFYTVAIIITGVLYLWYLLKPSVLKKTYYVY